MVFPKMVIGCDAGQTEYINPSIHKGGDPRLRVGYKGIRVDGILA